MKQLLLFSIVFSILYTPLEAQVSKTEMNREVFGNPFNSSNSLYLRMLNSNNEILEEKNYFVFEDWTEMNIEGNDGQLIHMDSANYFIPENKIIFLDDGKMMTVFPDKAKVVNFGDKMYIPYRDDNKIGEVNKFYELLSDGDLSLLKLWESEEKVVTNNPLGIADKSKVEIRKKSSFYYLKKDGLRKLPKKKRDIIKVFRAKQTKMTSFAVDNDLTPKKEEHLVLLFDYYNSLQ